MEALEPYDYNLPAELIAVSPAEPRDSSRLFVYDTKSGKIAFDYFRNLADYLPKSSLLVLNNTKVVPARLTLVKENGVKVEALLLVNEPRGDTVRALVNKNVRIGERLKINDSLWFEAVGQDEKVFLLKPGFPQADLANVLERFGATPVPKYIKASLSEQELRGRYQSLFAEKPFSVAAPTASLHFTEGVFQALKAKDITRAFVTLHIGLGTFSPLSQANLERGTLHPEMFEIAGQEALRIAEARRKGNKIVAVGTTAARVLESNPEISANPQARAGETELFIRPPYRFNGVDILITNFHLPKSSLMMLVDAFLQHKGAAKQLRDLYEIAVAHKFRFYSFGDSMLIL